MLLRGIWFGRELFESSLRFQITLWAVWSDVKGCITALASDTLLLDIDDVRSLYDTLMTLLLLRDDPLDREHHSSCCCSFMAALRLSSELSMQIFLIIVNCTGKSQPR